MNILNAHFCPTTSKFSQTPSLSLETPVRPRWVACISVDMDLQFTESGADEQCIKLSIVSSYTFNIVCIIQENYYVAVSAF